MQCEISGQIPEEPVVTPQGRLFERRLIEKAIEQTGKCPVTGEDLSKEDLIVLQRSPQSVKPRPVTATSIPGMLSLFQKEWDALMMETFTLKKHLDTARQELSRTLYQHDGACRVIARLTRERDEAREALAAARVTTDSAEAMDAEPENVVPKAVLKDFMAVCKRLSKERRKRPKKKPAEVADALVLEKYTASSSYRVHKAAPAGVLCVAVDPKNPSLTLTGGMDGDAILFNRGSEKVEVTMTGHGKKVNCVAVHPTENLMFTGSADKTVRVWSPQQGGGERIKAAHIFKHHNGAIVGLDVQPMGEHVLAASHDGYWSLSAIRTGQSLVSFANPTGAGFSCAEFHPDGLIVGVGTDDAVVRLWDLKVSSIAATLEDHKKRIAAVAFSEKGYLVATASEDATVKLWDLRKCECMQTLEMGSFKPISLAFDYSGTYLAVGGQDVGVFAVNEEKKWIPVTKYSDAEGAVTGLAWGPDASFLAASSMDRTLKFYSS